MDTNTKETTQPKVANKKIRNVTMIIIGLAIVFTLVFGSWIFEYNEAHHFKIKQSLSGDMSAYTDPGWFVQWFGTITEYSKSNIKRFSYLDFEGEDRDESIGVRYRDGGTAKISGSIRYVMPYDSPDKMNLILLHKAFRSENNFVDRTIDRSLTEAIQQSAGFFTSEESYTTHKATYTNYVRDQLMNGVYLVEQIPDTTFAPNGEITILPKSVIRRDADGNILRKKNPLDEYGVSITVVTIYDPFYEQEIQDQIEKRLTADMLTIVAKSEAKLRAQEQITAKAVGERDVESTRYEQLVANITEETEAEQIKQVAEIKATQLKEVARINKKAKQWDGKAQKEIGRGESVSKSLLQKADNNLDIILAVQVEKHRQIADAIQHGKAIMPEIIMGANAGGGQGMLEIMGINAAQNMVKKK